MIYSIYIDYPNGFDNYEFLPGEKWGSDVVSRKLGIRVKFVCNSLAKISKGDIYEVQFETLEDVTVFLLKNEYIIVSKDKIEKYCKPRASERIEANKKYYDRT